MAGPNDQNGTPTEAQTLAAIETVRGATKSSLDSIVDNSFNGAIPIPNIQVPIGDASPNQFGTQTSGAQVTPPTEPLIPTIPNSMLSDLDKLESEIDTATLEGKTPESVRSFEGLKARYKNKLAPIREQLKTVENRISDLQAALDKAKAYEADAQKYTEAQSLLTALETEQKDLRQEVESLRVFRLKDDLDSDPQIKREYLNPMNELKSRSLDILEASDLDESVWKDLLETQSEAKLNAKIDAADISGLNAQSLKAYVQEYKSLKADYAKVSSPEYIAAALDTARGRSQRASETKAKEVFENIKTKFSNHVKELKESSINKEHNMFVYDKVIAQAQTNFESLKKTLGSEYQNEGVLGVLAQAALMTAAYPSQDKLIQHMLKERTELLAEIGELKGTPGISQTREVVGSPTFMSEMQQIKQAAGKSLDSIVNETFK